MLRNRVIESVGGASCPALNSFTVIALCFYMSLEGMIETARQSLIPYGPQAVVNLRKKIQSRETT